MTDLTPNMNYSFGSQYFEGFDVEKPPTSSVSESTPAIGTYFALPLPMLWADIATAALRTGAWALLGQPWKRLWSYFSEPCTEAESQGSFGLRTRKLRLDVVDRNPPAVLS